MQKFSIESTTGLKGTSIYIVPEGWDNCDYSKVGEVYAIAMIAYEMQTLEEPFKGFSHRKICKSAAIERQRPKIKNSFPSCYRNLIERC